MRLARSFFSPTRLAGCNSMGFFMIGNNTKVYRFATSQKHTRMPGAREQVQGLRYERLLTALGTESLSSYATIERPHYTRYERLFNISNAKTQGSLLYVNILQFYTPLRAPFRIVVIIIIFPTAIASTSSLESRALFSLSLFPHRSIARRCLLWQSGAISNEVQTRYR